MSPHDWPAVSTKKLSHVFFLKRELKVCHQFLAIFGISFGESKQNKWIILEVVKTIIRTLLVITYALTTVGLFLSLFTRLTVDLDEILYALKDKRFRALHKIAVIANSSVSAYILVGFSSKAYKKRLINCNRSWKQFLRSYGMRFDANIQRRNYNLLLRMAVLLICTMASWLSEAYYIFYSSTATSSCFLVVFCFRVLLAMIGLLITFAAVIEFVVICDVLQACFEGIHSEIKGMARNADSLLEGRVREIRIRHNEAIEIVTEANKYWKSFLFVFYTIFVPLSVCLWYGVFYIKLDITSRITLIFCSLCHALFVATVSIKAAGVNAWAHEPYSVLYSLTTINQESAFLSEVTLFLHRLQGTHIGFSCANMFTVTPNILVTVTTAVITYILALRSGVEETCA